MTYNLCTFRDKKNAYKMSKNIFLSANNYKPKELNYKINKIKLNTKRIF